MFSGSQAATEQCLAYMSISRYDRQEAEQATIYIAAYKNSPHYALRNGRRPKLAYSPGIDKESRNTVRLLGYLCTVQEVVLLTEDDI